MRKYFTSFLALLIFCQSGISQRPEELLENWSSRSPIEKIHLHLDRENYLAGETAWFKAYLYSDYQPDTISSTLYLELVSGTSAVLVRKILPVLFGATNGHLDLPDSLATGSYSIRAWTPTMLNHHPDFIFQRNIFIYGKNTVASPTITSLTAQLDFFPEGGNLVTGVPNTIAFKATNEKGMPLSIKGTIWNEKNEAVVQLSSIHDGMGLFELVPSGQKYYATIAGDPANRHIELPVSANKGVALTIIPHPQGHFFEMKQVGADPLFQAAYMVGQMQHHLVFRQEFKPGKNEIQGLINTQHLHSGILQVTVFNKEGMPLAERLCFVNNKEYIQAATLVTDTLNLGEKAKNRFSIKLKDTIQGSFSISVSDADYDIHPRREENIFSQLLLSSDLKGYIHDPAYYFTSDSDAVSTALDLVMMTHGWRRFSWTSLPKPAQTATYADPGFINLAGKATLRDSKKPFDSKPLLVYIVGSDSARSMQLTRTDKEGRFSLDSLLFFGPARILFSDTRGKKSLYIDVFLSADSLTRSFTLPAISRRSPSREEGIPGYTRIRLADDLDAIIKANGLLLQGVTIRVKKKSPIEELEEKYASGMFAGFSEKTYDLTNNNEAENYSNIFDYLQFRVPGLDVGNDGADYVVYYRQGPSASSMGPIPMILYLNEIETDANVISTISPNQIALVKVYSSFVGATGNAAGGVMAIYTKKGDDLFSAGGGRADNLRYTGFSVIKEFYSPNYAADPGAKSKTDTRITLQWKPDIMVSGVNPTIPLVFYNNDRTKRFRVVVEGMTLEGKMVMIEQIIERKGF